MNQYVRRPRHWKQRFDPEADFVWRKPFTVNGTRVRAGEPVDKELFPPQLLKVKLRRFWESEAIELAPLLGQPVPPPKGGDAAPNPVPRVIGTDGVWFTVQHGEDTYNVLGKERLENLMGALSDAS